MKSSFFIETEGDLEVIVLREAHSFLASLMHPDIYEVVGKSPNQNAAFTPASFNLFLVWLTEFFSIGMMNYRTKGKYSNMSLSEGIKWFCTKYSEESDESGLKDAFDRLEGWVLNEHEYNFYSGDVDIEFKIYLSRKDLFNYCSNITKHNILRLNVVLTKLKRLYKKYGYDLSYSEVLSTLDEFEEHIRGAMGYYASYIIELLGHVFLGLNEVICKRYEKQGTNDASKMKYPKDISSDVFRELYSDTLVFQSYTLERIKDSTPTTWEYLKRDYILKDETN